MIQIFATDMRTGIREEITSLYWFEENGIIWFDDPVLAFEIYVDGVLVAATPSKSVVKRLKAQLGV